MFLNVFATFDPDAAQNVEKKKTMSRPVTTKLHTLSTQPKALCLQATNSIENQKSVSENLISFN